LRFLCPKGASHRGYTLGFIRNVKNCQNWEKQPKRGEMTVLTVPERKRERREDYGLFGTERAGITRNNGE